MLGCVDTNILWNQDSIPDSLVGLGFFSKIEIRGIPTADIGRSGFEIMSQHKGFDFLIFAIDKIHLVGAGSFVGVVRNNMRLTLGVKIHPEGEVHSHGNVGYSGVAVFSQGGAHDCDAQQQRGREDQQFLHRSVLPFIFERSGRLTDPPGFCFRNQR